MTKGVRNARRNDDAGAVVGEHGLEQFAADAGDAANATDASNAAEM